MSILSEEAIITPTDKVKPTPSESSSAKAEQPLETMRPNAFRTLVFGLLFGALFLITPGYFLYRYLTITDYLYERYYEYPAESLPAEFSNAEAAIANLGETALPNGSSESYYAGICCLETQNPEKAINYLSGYLESAKDSATQPMYFVDAAEWYLAMAHLKNGDCPSARAQLGLIQADSTHDFYAKSGEIIARMD